jgi:hypothetical protein
LVLKSIIQFSSGRISNSSLSAPPVIENLTLTSLFKSWLEFAIVPGPDSKKFTLKGDGGNLIPYTLTLEATASAQNKPYQVKVLATLTTGLFWAEAVASRVNV